jgi:hypothetical protein
MSCLNEDSESSLKKPERTRITDLSLKAQEQQIFSYLDESKKDHQCIITMMNHDNQDQLPLRTNQRCFWCHHTFEYRPLGCPIKYIPHRITKHYYSEMTKDNYTLRENISLLQYSMNKKLYDEKKMDIVQQDCYVTDGIFCSFNCCLAFILYNHSNPFYVYSEQLLNNIYMDLFGKNVHPILPAPSWRILKEYGGILTIEEFRKNFYKIDYKDMDNIIFPFLKFRPSGFLFEKQIRI